jgi:hypothetical protein
LFFPIQLLRRDDGISVRILAAAIAVHLVLMGFYHIWRYPYAAYIMLRPNRRENFIEYKIAQAVNDLHPHGRVLVLGGTRFRLNSWFLLPQVGGTFESGLTNRLSIDVIYSIRTGIGVPPESRGKQQSISFAQLAWNTSQSMGRSRRNIYDYAWVPLPWDRMFERVWHGRRFDLSRHSGLTATSYAPTRSSVRADRSWSAVCGALSRSGRSESAASDNRWEDPAA